MQERDSVGVAVVTVSFNTAELTALLLWSLHRVLAEPPADILVVDNGSTDGSAQLLAAVADAGLCRAIANDRNRHHGPGLNQAMTSLTSHAAPPRWIWVLDSDVVIARDHAMGAAVAAAERDGAAIVGERHWDPWKQQHRFELYSLLVDPAQVWRPGWPTFQDDGDPSFELLRATEAAGLTTTAFPFAAEGHLIHRGRASLATLVEADDRAHPLFEWAVDHHEPHFGGVPGARERYQSLLAQFRHEVGELQPSTLIAACRRGPDSSY